MSINLSTTNNTQNLTLPLPSVQRGNQSHALVVDGSQRPPFSPAVTPATPSVLVSLSDVTKQGETYTEIEPLPTPKPTSPPILPFIQIVIDQQRAAAAEAAKQISIADESTQTAAKAASAAGSTFDPARVAALIKQEYMDLLNAAYAAKNAADTADMVSKLRTAAVAQATGEVVAYRFQPGSPWEVIAPSELAIREESSKEKGLPPEPTSLTDEATALSNELKGGYPATLAERDVLRKNLVHITDQIAQSTHIAKEESAKFANEAAAPQSTWDTAILAIKFEKVSQQLNIAARDAKYANSLASELLKICPELKKH